MVTRVRDGREAERGAEGERERQRGRVETEGGKTHPCLDNPPARQQRYHLVVGLVLRPWLLLLGLLFVGFLCVQCFCVFVIGVIGGRIGE